MSDISKKNSLYTVTIHDKDHYVRAESKRQAQQLAIDDRVSVRKADDDDIIRIVRSQARIINDVQDAEEESEGLFAGSPVEDGVAPSDEVGDSSENDAEALAKSNNEFPL